MSDLDWVPEGIDTTGPSVARTYDYLLGGARDRVRLNRSFPRRAVAHLAELGVRRFLDIGSAIPTAGNVHEIAREVAPGVVGHALWRPGDVADRAEDSNQVWAGVDRKPDREPGREPVAGGRR